MKTPRTPILLLLLLLLVFSLPVSAQGPWTEKASMPGNARHRAFSFSIGGRGYLGCGWNGITMYQDFWEYDPGTDSWAQKADYPGGPRLSAYGFSVGNKGYAGTGLDATLIAQSDCYVYDPAMNTWTIRAPFIGVPVFGTTSLSYNNKGYVAFGDEWDPTYYRHNELWSYDPALDSWSQLTSSPTDGRRDAVGFAVGTKIYFGTGNDNSGAELNDLWEYDPAADTWTAKTSFAGSARSQAVGFAVGGKGYVGTGGLADVQDFYRYDPLTDAWDSINAFPGAGRENAMTFVIGSKGYFLCGTSGINYRDLWEFNPAMITGIKDCPPLAGKVSIYPNPVTTTATLSVEGIGYDLCHFELYDLTGKKIMQNEFRGNEMHFTREGIAAGCYLYQLTFPDTKIASGKLIVR